MDIVLNCFEQQPRSLSSMVLLTRFKPAYIVDPDLMSNVFTKPA
eukprot:gene12354-8838_t